eukprot:4800531-Prymnesium_polylepis.1
MIERNLAVLFPVGDAPRGCRPPPRRSPAASPLANRRRIAARRCSRHRRARDRPPSSVAPSGWPAPWAGVCSCCSWHAAARSSRSSSRRPAQASPPPRRRQNS